MDHKPRRGAGKKLKWIMMGLGLVSNGSVLLNLYVYRSGWLLFVGFLAAVGFIASGIYLLTIST